MHSESGAQTQQMPCHTQYGGQSFWCELDRAELRGLGEAFCQYRVPCVKVLDGGGGGLRVARTLEYIPTGFGINIL